MTKKVLLPCSALALLFVFVPASPSQLATGPAPAPSWVGNLISGNTNFLTLVPASDPIWSDPATTESASDNPPHMPRGSVYKLFGTAQNGVDPQNPFNDVISFDTRNGAIAGALRILGDHVQVKMLTNQIELKYYFASPRTCGGGSPRIQLAIDGDGDGDFKQSPGSSDQNAFGYLGDKPFGGACAMDMWVHEDMTDLAPKWDLSQWVATGKVPACDMTCTWQEVVTYFQTFWPNHRVLNAVLVDDSSSFFATDGGCAYFDLVNTGARTYTNREDASGNGSAQNNCQ
jgi:hypothetical protein